MWYDILAGYYYVSFFINYIYITSTCTLNMVHALVWLKKLNELDFHWMIFGSVMTSFYQGMNFFSTQFWTWHKVNRQTNGQGDSSIYTYTITLYQRHCKTNLWCSWTWVGPWTLKYTTKYKITMSILRGC